MKKSITLYCDESYTARNFPCKNGQLELHKTDSAAMYLNPLTKAWGRPLPVTINGQVGYYQVIRHIPTH